MLWRHRLMTSLSGFKEKNGWRCRARAKTDVKITKETVYHCYSSCETFAQFDVSFWDLYLLHPKQFFIWFSHPKQFFIWFLHPKQFFTWFLHPKQFFIRYFLFLTFFSPPSPPFYVDLRPCWICLYVIVVNRLCWDRALLKPDFHIPAHT